LVFVLGLVLAGASNAADPDLVGWWKLEEASGDLMDSSDKGNHGTFNGTLYQQPGVEGYALGFNGVSDRLKCGDNGRPSNTFSFGAWIKTTVPHEVDSEADQYGGVNGQHYAVESRFQGANAGAGLSVGTNGIAVYEHGDNYMPGVAVYEGEIGEDWNHIMVVYDKKQPTIYLNGKAVRTGQVSTRPEIIAPRRFGGMAYGFFEGVMDEIQVYADPGYHSQPRLEQMGEILSISQFVLVAEGGWQGPDLYAYEVESDGETRYITHGDVMEAVTQIMREAKLFEPLENEIALPDGSRVIIYRHKYAGRRMPLDERKAFIALFDRPIGITRTK